jgi:hypothetical protein
MATNINSTTSQHFVCGICGAPVALGVEIGGDVVYVCTSTTCGHSVMVETAGESLRLSNTEFAEWAIAETLCTLGAAETAVNRLDPDLAFDVGCALSGARGALERALAAFPASAPVVLELPARIAVEVC